MVTVEGKAVIRLRPTEAGNAVYYTTDGSEPTTFSPQWAGEDLTVWGHTRLRTIEVSASGTASRTTFPTVFVKLPTEGIIGTATGSGYSIDFPSDWQNYSGITIDLCGSDGSVIQSIDYASDPQGIEVQDSGQYSIIIRGSNNFSTERIVPPTMSYIANTQTGAVTVTLSASEGQIYYTTDGSVPTVESGTLYSAPFTATPPLTVKAIAVDGARVSSVFSGDIEALPKSVTPQLQAIWRYEENGTGILSLFIVNPQDYSGAVHYYSTDGSYPSVVIENPVQDGRILVIDISSDIPAIAIGEDSVMIGGQLEGGSTFVIGEIMDEGGSSALAPGDVVKVRSEEEGKIVSDTAEYIVPAEADYPTPSVSVPTPTATAEREGSSIVVTIGSAMAGATYAVKASSEPVSESDGWSVTATGDTATLTIDSSEAVTLYVKGFRKGYLPSGSATCSVGGYMPAHQIEYGVRYMLLQNAGYVIPVILSNISEYPSDATLLVENLDKGTDAGTITTTIGEVNNAEGSLYQQNSTWIAEGTGNMGTVPRNTVGTVVLTSDWDYMISDVLRLTISKEGYETVSVEISWTDLFYNIGYGSDIIGYDTDELGYMLESIKVQEEISWNYPLAVDDPSYEGGTSKPTVNPLTYDNVDTDYDYYVRVTGKTGGSILKEQKLVVVKIPEEAGNTKGAYLATSDPTVGDPDLFFVAPWGLVGGMSIAYRENFVFLYGFLASPPSEDCIITLIIVPKAN